MGTIPLLLCSASTLPLSRRERPVVAATMGVEVPVNFIKGQTVEVSSDDEGFTGALYIAKIVKVLEGRRFLVEYETLVSEEDEKKPLKEKVDGWHVRPCPPEVPRDVGFDVHEEVDAFHNEGWWIGVVSKVVGGGKYNVYFRDSKEEIEFGQSLLRVHQEWIDGKWVTSPKVRIMMKLRVDVEFDPALGFCSAHGTSVEYESPINSVTVSKRKQKLLVVRKNASKNLPEPPAMISQAVVSLEEEIPISSEAQPQNEPKLPYEKYGLPEKPFLDLQAMTTQTNGFLDVDGIDQITTASAPSSRAYRRKRRLASHSEVDASKITLQVLDSQTNAHEGEVGTGRVKKPCRTQSHKDEMEKRAALFLPKLKAKLILQDASNKQNIPVKMADDSFPDDILFIRVPYLRRSKSGVGENDSGTVAGYGSKKDLNRVAYHFVLQALYFQGEHKWKHELWLTELRGALGISNDDHFKELKCVTSGENISAS